MGQQEKFRTTQGFGAIAKTFFMLALIVLVSGCQFGKPQPNGDPAELARVTVQGAGLHKVTARALADMGWTAETPLTLRFNGDAVPFQARGGELVFYLPQDTPARYSQQHTLWLTPESTPAESAPVADDAEVSELVGMTRLGVDEQYSTSHPGDPWFWRTVSGPGEETVTIPTPNRLEGEVRVTVNAAGVTKVPHHIGVTIGDQAVGALQWEGTARYSQTLTFSLPAGDEVALLLTIPEGTTGVDISMLDEIVVEYPSTPAANVDNRLFYGRSITAGSAAFEGTGSTPVAWQLTPEIAPLPVSESGSVTLPPDGLVIVADPAAAREAQVSRAGDATLPNDGADYVAIVDPVLQEALAPLLDYHRKEGLSVISYTPQQVYDAYSHGNVDPLAFRAMLKEGLEAWDTGPRYVLLVGDSTYDPGGFLNELPPTYVPSPFVDSVFGGETVSDNVIADVDEDGYPDVALGRLPARTVTQLETIVRKTVEYSENPEAGEWRARVLFAADGREEMFKDTSERLRTTYMPAGVEGVAVYPAAASDAAAQMLPELSAGSVIVNYVGHGSVQQWGRDQLLTTESVPRITNGSKLPIYINMTCLTGLFSHPNQESLAETLLWSNVGGSVASIAPTSLTLPTSQSTLNSTLLEELLSPERPTIGEALTSAKRAINLTGANEHDIVATFNLLGDPALRPAPIPNFQ